VFQSFQASRDKTFPNKPEQMSVTIVERSPRQRNALTISNEAESINSTYIAGVSIFGDRAIIPTISSRAEQTGRDRDHNHHAISVKRDCLLLSDTSNLNRRIHIGGLGGGSSWIL
jgi:hypothetical protein